MIAFLLSAVSLITITLLLLLMNFRRHKKNAAYILSETDPNQLTNISITRQRIRELELQRDVLGEKQYQQQLKELEIALIDDIDFDHCKPTTKNTRPPTFKNWPILAGVIIITVSTGLYMATGSPYSLLSNQAVKLSDPSSRQKENLNTLAEMFSMLEQKLQQNPDNPNIWALAGQSYMAALRFTDAERAYQKLHQLIGDDPDILVDWANASIMAADRQFNADIIKRLERALELNPNHHNGLWLAAIAAESTGAQQQAISYWQRLLPLTANDSKANEQVKSSIVQAELRLSERTSNQPKQ